MDFRLLGVMTVTSGAVPVPIGRRREQLLLAALLFNLGQPVEFDRLVDLLWPDAAPRDPRATLFTHVSRLRRALATADAVRIETVGSAYVLHADPATVDAYRFTELVRDAQAYDDPAQRAAGFRAALELWRGDPLLGLATDPYRAQVCPQLAELRLTALEARVAADLELGRHEDLVAELTGLVAAYPRRERIVAALMTALHRCGRSRDALDAYATYATGLADEAGLDPGERLRELRTAVLRGDPDLAAAGWHGGARLEPAHQLTAAAVFVGREREMGRLAAAATAARYGRSPLVTVSGLPGVGKTALALHASHALREDFPDGVIYVDLRGFSAQSPMEPVEALGRMLTALGVTGVPNSAEARAAELRGRLAPARTMLVFDNAATESQVSALRCGGPHCLTLVTSRLSLTGMEATLPIRLDVLAPADARQLLVDLIGPRATSDPVAAEQVVTLCGRLPLALRLAAARLRHRDAWTVSHLASRLSDDTRRLDELRAGDRSVAAAIATSLEDLPAAHRATLLYAAAGPAVEISEASLSATAGIPVREASRHLSDLVDVSLLEERTAGRYEMHDLVRLYATEAAPRHLSAEVLSASQRRLVAYYLRGVAAAMTVIHPHLPGTPMEGVPDVAGWSFEDPTAARRWLDTERDTIVGLFEATLDGNCFDLLATLLRVISYDLQVGSHYRAAVRMCERVCRMAETRGDDAIVRVTLHRLAAFRTKAGDDALASDDLHLAIAMVDDATPATQHAALLAMRGEHALHVGEVAHAVADLDRAAAIFRDADQPHGAVQTLTILAPTLWSLGRVDEALECAGTAIGIAEGVGNQNGAADARLIRAMVARLAGCPGAADDLISALDTYERAGNRTGQSYVLGELGALAVERGDLPEAYRLLRRALRLAHEVGDRNAEFEALLHLGTALRAVGDLDDAVHHHRAAAELANAMGRPRDHLRAYDGLAAALHAGGRTAQALGYWRNTLARFGSLALPEVATARSHLDAVELT